MASFWERLFNGEAKVSPTPKEPPDAYPNTFLGSRTTDSGAVRPEVFEPALQHFPKAFRRGDPVFKSAEIERAWRSARQRVMNHLLHLIAASRWKDHLVLRGSLLLQAWLGDVARAPGDMDWVFQPKNVNLRHAYAAELFIEVLELVSNQQLAGDCELVSAKAAIDDIWTYERAAGRRLVIPWNSPGLPPGEVQMDVVFGEEIYDPPIKTSFLTSPTQHSTVWTASRELSLAWKLLWLETDMHPQGKDLYDATVLAERTKLPFQLLHRVIHAENFNRADKLQPDFPMKWSVDWDNFKLEYPWISGSVIEWQERLTQALSGTFTSDRSS